MGLPTGGCPFLGIVAAFFGLQLLCGGCSGVQSVGAATGQGVAAGRTLDARYEPVREEMLPLIERVRKKYGIVGMSLALVDQGRIVWAEGFGKADRAADLPATADTVYRVGSVAKPFTATAVMQLQEQGVVELDRPLSLFLPGFSIRSRFNTTVEPITVRSVLTHHAGLPTDLGKGMWSDQHFSSVPAKLSEEYAAFPPNLVFSYSNVGYTLLGQLIQETSGDPFETYMREAVFEPVGMQHSGYQVSAAMRPFLSSGYRESGRKGELLPMRDLAAFGMLSSASDLARFMGVLMAHPDHGDTGILEHESVLEMLRVQNGDVDLDLNIRNGMGWFLEHGTIPGAEYVARHGGTTLMFSAEMVMLPKHKLGVAVISNTRGTRKVVSHVAEDILTLVLSRDRSDVDGDAMRLAEWHQPIRKERAIPMIGSFATGLGMVAIRPRSDKLCACVADATLDLIPMPNGWYGVHPSSVDSLPKRKRALGKLRFATRHIDGRDVIIAERDGKEVLLGEKVPDTPVPEVWRKRVGPYKLLNPDSDFPLEDPTVWYKDGNLGMSYRMPALAEATISVPLQPISDTEAIILGLGRTRGETLRAFVENGQEKLRYSGFIGRKL